MKKRRFTEKKSISSVFSLFLAFALMVTSVLGSSLGTLEVQAAEGTLSGSGTYNDPYIIEDAADLKAFAALLDGKAENIGLCAKVADGVTSIDVSDATWQPMPANVKDTEGKDLGYIGVFDGNGATINLNVDKSEQNAGLFSIIGVGGEVKNVTTEGNVIGRSHVGGICGTNKGTISDCNNKANVKSRNSMAGGIAGYCESSGKIQFSGAMTNSGKINSNGSIGGIVGECKGSIEGAGELQNTGVIDGGMYYQSTGGIAGKLGDAAALKVTGEVRNTAEVSGATYTGGIVGCLAPSSGDPIQIQAGSILNTGNVTGSYAGNSIGGVIGYIPGKAEISAMTGDIRNTGAVKGPNTIGGVFGYCTSTTVTAAGDIVNTGEVAGNPSGNEIGGIVGKLNESQLIAVGGEIRNESSVTGATQVGGVAGRCDRNRTDSPIRAYGDIVNQGKISTTNAGNVGGIVGSYNCKEGIVSDTGVIKNEGAVEGIDTYVGGIVGSYNIAASTGAVQKCINTGDVTASKGKQVGGLFGYVSITSSTEEYRNIENSYSTGQVNITDATDATDSRNGTLVGGFNGNKIKNCYDTVTDALPMLGTTDHCQGAENCYRMSEDASVTEPEGVVVKTKAEFASGEVAYLLDGTGENRAEAPVWGQNIGTDESPVLGGAAVYKDGDVYANAEHTYDVTYTWSADKKSCTAKQNCRFCGIEGAKETVAAAYSIKKQATEQAEGIGLYTAVFKNGLFTTQTAEVKIAKLPPKPSQPTNPSNPSNPTKPSDPSKPTNPSNPSNPTKPTDNKKKPAAKGKTLKDSKGATYKVTGAKVKNPTVTYVKPKKNVKKVSIPATITVKGIKYQVTAVSKDAFKNNKKVTQVTIDKNVKNIGKNAFYGCKNLKKVIIKTTKLTKKTVGKNAFKGIHKKATIKVPKKKLNAYKKLLKNAGMNKSVKVVKIK
ncbi:MAG: leucine-rich repeat protein [Lachnospiraceae bacterium]|nr:leucine-rich repeat protein [Lachnospiraceae bacterium]